MPDAIRPQLQHQVNQRIAEALLVDSVVRPPVPNSLRGRLSWLGNLGASYLLLVLSVANLFLAFFDYSYFELRPVYLRALPGLVHRYDPVKGVSPHRVTEAYLQGAEATFEAVSAGAPVPSPARHLADMQSRSEDMIQEDPFAAVQMSGVFEHVKNLLRRHMRTESAKTAFKRFWSPENLTPERLPTERRFFEAKLRPLIGRNYFRAIGENGKPYDAFWLIDALFMPFFALDFLVRGRSAVQRGQFPSWKAFCYARWYDLAYFVPVGLYWLPLDRSGLLQVVRAVSVGNRMSRLGLFNPIAMTEAYTNRMVTLMTDLVSVRLLTNYQEAVRSFDLKEFLSGVTPEQRGQVRHLVEHHVEGLVLRVLPQLTEELRELVTYSARQALNESPSYQQLRRIPLFGSLPERYLKDLVSELIDGTQRALGATLRDRGYRHLLDSAIEKAAALMIEELERLNTEHDLKAIALDFLEHQKQQLLS